MQSCLVHDYHPPHEVRLFGVPTDAIRRWDDTAFVYDIRVGELVLRHYAFATHWFAVNCTLDLSGNFVIDPGPFGYTFNCDIATPIFNHGTDLFTVDLFLDVLVGPDGRTHQVIDEDEFVAACEQGWLAPDEQRGARHGLSTLLSIVEGEGLTAFLDRVVSFSEVHPVVPPPMRKCDVQEIAMFAPAERSVRYGSLMPFTV